MGWQGRTGQGITQHHPYNSRVFANASAPLPCRTASIPMLYHQHPPTQELAPWVRDPLLLTEVSHMTSVGSSNELWRYPYQHRLDSHLQSPSYRYQSVPALFYISYFKTPALLTGFACRASGPRLSLAPYVCQAAHHVSAPRPSCAPCASPSRMQSLRSPRTCAAWCGMASSLVCNTLGAELKGCGWQLRKVV